MNIIRNLLAAAAVLASLSSVALAHEFKVGDLEIVHPNARAMLPGAAVGGGYLTIINSGSESDRLVGGATPAAGRVELHEMTMENDVMKMRALADGIEIPAGGTVELKPGGLHVMFLDVKAPFVEGDYVKATLNFEKAGPVEVEFAIGPAGGKDKGHGGHDAKTEGGHDQHKGHTN